MNLVSVNLSMPKTVDHLGRRVSTGIYNEPLDGRVVVRKLNVEGDGQADLTGLWPLKNFDTHTICEGY